MSGGSNPAYKWALWIYLVAFTVTCFQEWSSIDLSASSTAAIGYIFVPFVGAITALPFAVVGYALGALIRARQSRRRRHIIIASVTATLSVAYVAFMLITIVNDRQLAATITRLGQLNDTDLAAFLDNDTYRTNQYVLVAIAMNPAASSLILARIAAIDDVALHEKFGGPSELMGKNRRGLAVMRLVSSNPNVSPETLTLLSRSPDTYVLGDVAGNKATPKAVIERLYLERNNKSHSYLIEWGLANNKGTPETILRELAINSRNQYTLENIGRNTSAPIDVKNFVRERISGGDYER